MDKMTPEQQKALQEAFARASPEQRKKMQETMLAQMTPEQRAQAEATQRGMMDMSAFCEKIKPEPSDPDKPLSTYEMVSAFATCPSFENGGDLCDPATIDAIETVLLEQADEADAAGLRENKEAPAAMRRNVLLLYFALYRLKVGEAVTLDAPTEQHIMRVKQLATKVLMQAQMLVPQQRWVQATLGVARLSALLVNELWSGEEEQCKARMKEILEGDGMIFPRLKLRSRTISGAAAAQAAQQETASGAAALAAVAEIGEAEEPCSSMPGQAVVVQVEVAREHAGGTASAAISSGPMNPHGILEAYWLYVEGVKPQGTPNSLLGMQPLVVTDLSVQAHVTSSPAPTSTPTP